MKKIIVLFCLMSISMQAKFIKATLTFENGTTKEGFAEMVEINDSKVKFRLTEKGDTEKILSEGLKKIEFSDSEGNISIAERLFINTDKGEKGIKQTGKKYWLYVVYSKGIKLAVDIAVSTFRYNPSNGTSTGMSGGTILYMGKEKEDGVFFIFYLSDMMSINVGLDKTVRKHCDLLFKDCPKFLAAVNAENFKKTTLINKLIELYETNDCNKPAKVEAPKKASPKKKK
ncbi:hypothetical protein [Flavobacterium sp. PL002]|uniref:hypothetical protein n=1 Tax=Flavobacterium sp. PL002 TaxID=1897058 RepID=UPI00178818D6|nr:hypothetical protein [Flavobacterium sp. PL002]MBE0392624.1 hypothetical protein [Flavobacterium sp. PL002]